MLDRDACYRALQSKDRRFDGLFYVGVRTTGIYCRPVCPARVPAASRCDYFVHAAEAEHAGFRACFRCRPELAPREVASDLLRTQIARAALTRIDEGFLDENSLEDLARVLEVSSRHLRRIIEEACGVSPVEYASTRRLALAKRLLHDSDLSMAHVAMSAGFGSVRRFNGAFRERFGMAPTEVRRAAMTDAGENASATVKLRLDYRPPLAWAELLDFLRLRAIPGVEEVSGDIYTRRVVLGEHAGTVRVMRASDTALVAHASVTLVPVLAAVLSRLRALFDLDAQPTVIDATLARDATLRKLVRARPGLRVPGAFDTFEITVRAMLGQQISVRAATTLAKRLVDKFGGGRAFPTASVLAAATPAAVREIGLPMARAASLHALATRVTANEGRVDVARLGEVRGIGPWTEAYVAMRVSRAPDAFLPSDLVVKKALGVTKTSDALARAEAWRPFRAYATLHLWHAQSHGELS